LNEWFVLNEKGSLMMELKILPEIEENLFPLQPEELKFLEESILAEGVRDALVVWPKDGELILVDGHNRYRIAKQHDIPFEIKEKHFNDLDEVLEWVDFNQLGRRNLIDEQRAIILGRIYKRRKKQGERKDLEIVKKGTELKVNFTLSSVKPFTKSNLNPTAQTVASMTGFSEKTIRNAADFTEAVDKIKETSPKATEIILSGKIKDALTELPRLVKKNPEKLSEVVKKISAGESKSIKQLVTELKRKEAQELSPPAGKYRVIYADPPWQYNNSSFTTSAEGQYPTMSTEEICNLPVKDLADDNAVLFLWVTNPLLEDALKVCKAWGFDYKTNFVWVKNQHTGGFYCFGQHELLFIATKGSMLPKTGSLHSSVVNASRREHSRKPDEFYGIIEAMYDGPYIELFARNKREGWDGWGVDYGLFSETG